MGWGQIPFPISILPENLYMKIKYKSMKFCIINKEVKDVEKSKIKYLTRTYEKQVILHEL